MTQQLEPIDVQVQAASSSPGVVPVAVLAVVQLVDAEGNLRCEMVNTQGIAPERLAALREFLREASAT